MPIPKLIETTVILEEVMTTPSPALIEALAQTPGDLLILGASGKMGQPWRGSQKEQSTKPTPTNA